MRVFRFCIILMLSVFAVWLPQALASSSVDDIDWSPDGEFIAIDWCSYVAIYDQNLNLVEQINGTFCTDIAWSPDSRHLAMSSRLEDDLSHEYVYIWDIQQREVVGEIILAWGAEWRSLAWSPDGSKIAIADGEVSVWDVATSQLIWSLEGDEERIWMIEWSPDGNYLAGAVADNINQIRIWNMSTGEQTKILQGSTGYDMLSWVSDEQILARKKQGFDLWDIDAEQRLQSFSIGGIATALDTKNGYAAIVVAVGNGTNEIIVWDIRDNQVVTRTTSAFSALNGIALSPNAGQVAYVDDSGYLRLMDTTAAESR